MPVTAPIQNIAQLSNPQVDPRAAVNTTNRTLLNAPLIEFIQQEALKQYDQGGPQYYPNSTVAPFSQATQTAIQGAVDRFNQGPGPTYGGAQDLLGQTLRGDYLQAGPAFQNLQDIASGSMVGANPYAAQIGDRLTRDITNRVNSQFGASGRTGSGANVQALSRGIGDALAPMYANFYQSDLDRQLQANSLLNTSFGNERNRQLQAASLLPGLDAMRFSGLEQLAAAGSAQDNLLQRQLSDEVNRWNYNQNRDVNALSRLSGLIGAPIPGSIQEATPPGSSGNAIQNTLANVFGGYATGNLLFGNSGGLVGGLLGGISGFL